MQLRTAIMLAVGVVSAALAVFAYGVDVFERLELSTVDARFSIRGELAQPRDVVIVGIDDNTFSTTGLRWPFGRDVEAKVIRRLTAAHAKVIAEDIQYTEATTPMPGCGAVCDRIAARQDQALGLAVYEADRKGSRVVLSTTEVGTDGTTDVLGGNAALLGARVGNGNFVPDADGVIRRFPYEIDGLETFPVVAAERFLGRRLDASALPDRRAWIDFVGPPGTIPVISFSQVLNGTFDKAAVRGAMVIVGATAPSLQDVHPVATSGSSVMTGPELHANAIRTVLRDFPLRNGPVWLNVLVICLLAMAPPLLGLRLSGLPTVLAALALGGAYTVAVQYAFDHGTILSFVYPLGALGLATVGTLAVHYVLVALDRQRTHDTFARFVPEEVVNQVLARAEGGLRLGGVRVVGTCMFADLRGSTQFAESLPPEKVVHIINRYLGELTEAILGHGGTLISYLGDGFMAVFGAPIEQPDHADRAVSAAREILEQRLPRFNEWLRTQGHDEPFVVGIGINTGPFMAGNVGSERRLEYTAMGDTINSASRLEGATKESDFYVLVADSTHAALVAEAPDLVPVGEIDVRGRVGTIKTWSLERARKPQPVAEASVAELS